MALFQACCGESGLFFSKVKIKDAQKIPEILFIQKTLEGTKNNHRRATRGQGAHLARPRWDPCQQGAWSPGATPWSPLSPIFIPRIENHHSGALFSKPTSVPPPSRFRSQEDIIVPIVAPCQREKTISEASTSPWPPPG